MLDWMRLQSRSWLIYFFFAIIILVFAINFGPGFDQLNQTGCQGSRAQAVTVNGQSFSQRLFQMRWQTILRLNPPRKLPPNINKLPPQYKKTFIKQRQIQRLKQLSKARKDLMANFVNILLLAQKAKAYGIEISDQEIQDTIADSPDFQKEGLFDEVRFKRIVNNYYGMTTKQYSRYIELNMRAERMRDIIRAGINVTPQEVKESFDSKNNKVKVKYVEFDADKITLPVNIDKKKLALYQKDNDKKIRNYFFRNAKEFKSDKEIQVSHILIKFDNKVLETFKKDEKKIAAYKASKKKIIDGILAKARKNPKDFAKLAKKHHEGSPAVKAKGGDLGFISKKSAMVAPFLKASFELKKVDDISPAVETTFGYHIIKLTKIKPAKEDKLEDKKVKERIATKLYKKELQLDAVKGLAGKLLGQLKGKTTLDSLLAPYVKKKEAKKAKPTSKPAKKAATSKPAAKKGPHHDALFGKVEVKTSTFAKGAEFVPGVGESGKFIRLAFALQKKGDRISEPVAVERKIYIAQLVKKVFPKKGKFEKERINERKTLIENKRKEFMKVWYEKARKESKVWENPKLISPLQQR